MCPIVLLQKRSHTSWQHIKSPGVDGIPPKLLMETVEQISIPLARVFNLSLKEGVVPF